MEAAIALPLTLHLPFASSLAGCSSPSALSSSSFSCHAVHENHRFFATCSPGLEPLVAAELLSPAIGASHTEIGSAGVSFTGSLATGYKANLWLRCAIRVLLELASGSLPKRRDSVYDFLRDAVDWPLILVDERNGEEKNAGRRKNWKFRTFSVQSRVANCAEINNSMYASVRAKDAICDAIKDFSGGSKPDPPTDGASAADVPLFLSLYKDYAILYRDMSGKSLHRRGYRDAMHRACLNEAIAAAILTFAGWNQTLPAFAEHNRNCKLECATILNPMCGSGTILIEAALMATNKAPGLMRSGWPFQRWHDFDETLLDDCRAKALASEASLPRGARLLGNDFHPGALSLCLKDAKSAGVHHFLELSCKDCKDYIPPATPSLVAVNPPWGNRLGDLSYGDSELLASTWKALGRFLKLHCNRADVYVLCGNSSLSRNLHMKADRKWPLTIGGVDCRLLHYYVLPPKSKTGSDIQNSLCDNF